MISHLERMGEWSPEAQGGHWVKGADGPAVGARFQGTNGNAKSTWKTLATVTTCKPGQAFSFRVSVGPVKVATWDYAIESLAENSCRVTESWTDLRPGFAKFMGKLQSGVGDRSEHNRAGIVATLDKLAAAAQA